MKRARQAGLTIAELMISLALGLLVVLVAVTLLVSAGAGFVAQAEAASVDDAGRFALAVIERAARQASFVDWERDAVAGAIDPGAPPAVRGLDAASLSSSGPALDDPRPAAVNGSDVLALRFSGSGAGDGDGSTATCAGFSVGAGQEGWSIFYVGLGPGGEAELRCKFRGANNWSAEAVVGGVDSFQVLYGIDTDADGAPNRYLRATDINALDDALAAEGANPQERERDRMRKSWWKRVAGVKVSLLVHGARRAHQPGALPLYHMFGAAYADSGGLDAGTSITRASMTPALQQRERRLFTATILLRNQAGQP